RAGRLAHRGRPSGHRQPAPVPAIPARCRAPDGTHAPDPPPGEPADRLSRGALLPRVALLEGLHPGDRTLSILDGRSSPRVDVRQISLRGRTRMPRLVVDSGVSGPKVVVAGNLHGDEVTGVIALQDLAAWLPTAIRRGRVAIFPSLNPRGLERGSRTVPGDTDDPNRHFPGDAKGTPAEQH